MFKHLTAYLRVVKAENFDLKWLRKRTSLFGCLCPAVDVADSFPTCNY